MIVWIVAAVGGSLGRLWDDSEKPNHATTGSDLLKCCAAVVEGKGTGCTVAADGSVSYCPSVDFGRTPDGPPSG